MTFEFLDKEVESGSLTCVSNLSINFYMILYQGILSHLQIAMFLAREILWYLAFVSEIPPVVFIKHIPVITVSISQC